MKKILFSICMAGFFVGYAQSDFSTRSTQELLTRVNSLGNQAGDVSEFFSKAELAQLQAYYQSQGKMDISFAGSDFSVNGGAATAYGLESQADGFMSFDPGTGSGITSISGGSGTSGFEGAGAISNDNPEIGYAIDTAGTLYSINVSTGVYTNLGNVGITDMNGMEFNPATGTLYANTATNLYTINTTTQTATLVGSLGAGITLAVALAIDGDGVGYTYDLATDSLYSINLATGAATLIGAIGFDANFGQGMGWDATTDTVYMAAFNATTFMAEWRSVNTSTGMTTLVGNLVGSGALTQVAWVSIVGGGSTGAEYCDIVDLDCAIEQINSVTFAGIENLNTGCGTAATNDYTNMVAEVNIGETYEMSVEIEADSSFPDDNAFFFIDWNQNGVLDDEGEVYELVMHTGTSGTYTVDVEVPAGAMTGETRLRVGIAYNSGVDYVPQPCPGDDGTLFGEYEDYTVNVSNGGGPDPDCEVAYTGTLQDGLGNLQTLQIANDFTVAANTEMEVEQVTLNIFGNINTASVYIYEDGAGMPGALLGSNEALTPTSQTLVGTAFGFNVYEVVLDLPTAVTATGAVATETLFWVGVTTTVGSENAANYWEAADATTNGISNVSSDGGVTWTANSFAQDGAFAVSGTCGTLGITELESFDFAYYPNPVKDELNISAKKLVQSVSIYNLAGQQISTQKLNVTNGKVSTSALAPGVYVFRAILDGGQIETFKVIKK